MANWSADKIQQKSVDALIPYDRNPNIHPDSQINRLANSIREWGWTVPIIIDESDMVIAGHGRLFAAKKLEMDSVPCIVVEGWTEVQKKAYVIADNKLSEESEWDDSLYFSELRSIDKMGFNLTTIGFDSDFDFDSFSPNLDPSFTYSGVNDSDVDKARSKMDGQIGGLSEEKADRGIEVMCPHCAETFTFSGY
tara:strand:+ start:1647 stop:2228 length:582 start_codon:yes stop_codon:yes gene_type:complete